MALSDSEIAALLAGPAMPAPEGVTPDFTNPPHDNGIAWFVITFTLVVSTICVLIRAFDKCYLSRQWRTEEGMPQDFTLHIGHCITLFCAFQC